MLRLTGEIVGQFGHNGRNAGQFHWIHVLDIDAHGTIYTGEVDTGKRVQRFVSEGNSPDRDGRQASRASLWDHASWHAVGRDPDRVATLAHMRRLGHHLPSVALVAALLLLPRPGHTNGGDLPPQILLQGFVKPEGARLHLVVRIPLILLQNLNPPKRGPGYLDLVRIDKWLNQAAAPTGRDIELFEDDDRLVPTRSAAQISLDRKSVV